MANDWREIWSCPEEPRALAIATVIEAMGFPARVRDGGARLGARFAVETADVHWGDLADVIPDVVAEQDEFDARLARVERRSGRLQRWLLLGFGGVVVVMALTGRIEL